MLKLLPFSDTVPLLGLTQLPLRVGSCTDLLLLISQEWQLCTVGSHQNLALVPVFIRGEQRGFPWTG